eukprot:gene1169-biopygen3461
MDENFGDLHRPRCGSDTDLHVRIRVVIPTPQGALQRDHCDQFEHSHSIPQHSPPNRHGFGLSRHEPLAFTTSVISFREHEEKRRAFEAASTVCMSGTGLRCVRVVVKPVLTTYGLL